MKEKIENNRTSLVKEIEDSIAKDGWKVSGSSIEYGAYTQAW